MMIREIRSLATAGAVALTLATSAHAQAGAAGLEARIKARLDSIPAQTAIYVKHLGTGKEIAIRADVPMNTASVIKIPVMVRLERDADSGKVNLDERHTVAPEEMRRGSGLLQTFQPGINPTWRDITQQMIITSDNTATDLSIHKVGLPRVNEMLKAMGYTNTRLLWTTGDLFRQVWMLADTANRHMTDRQVFEKQFPGGARLGEKMTAFVADSSKWLGRTTAREIARMLEGIEKCTVASKRACDEMRGFLRNQLYASRLPQRISFRAQVAHKTGDWPPLLGNDVGIIYGPTGPIVIAVFTNLNKGPFFELEAMIGKIAEDVLDSWGK